jgi:hypothetical protein
MKILIDNVKADIESGKSKMIYFSSRTLWWSHLDSDVEEATKQGLIETERRHNEFMANPKNSQADKDKMAALKQQLSTIQGLKEGMGGHGLPTDPTGAPLLQMDGCMKWISEAEAKPEHFGEFGLYAFMTTHHQNAQGNGFGDWSGVTAYLKGAAISICPNHPKYQVPLIPTMAFMGSEYWCPYCGVNLGVFDKTGVANPITLQLFERDLKYKSASKEYLRARSISACSETEWEGKRVSPMDLPLEERQRIQSVIDTGWKREVKVD